MVKDNDGNVTDGNFKINIPAYDPPVLTTPGTGSVNRSSDTNATVKFDSDKAGKYYYVVVDAGSPKPNIDTSGPGANCVIGENTIILDPSSGFGSGAKDIYIVVKDSNGNITDGNFKITVPAYTAGKNSNNVYSVTTHFGAFAGSGSASARVDADHTKFTHLTYGSMVIDRTHYTITQGSTIITISETHLKTYAAGTHTFVAHFTDGTSEDIVLTVAATGATTNTLPGTGESVVLPVLIFALLIAGLASLAVVAARTRKAKADDEKEETGAVAQNG